jgi:Uma2 family endonuclease
MRRGMPVSEATYKQVALEDPRGSWELVCGHLRQKPIMTTEHEGVVDALYAMLTMQIDRTEYRLRTNSRLRRASGSYYVPDLFVLPRAYELGLRAHPRTCEVYDDPMPLVAEVWSPSTGDYDVNDKLEEYKRRGDQEIWLIHPYDRTLTAWRRQTDGTYTETVVTGGVIRPMALPNVTIDFDSLFD